MYLRHRGCLGAWLTSRSLALQEGVGAAPPLAPTCPVSDVFRHLTPMEWALFKQLLQEQIHTAVAEGRWKQGQAASLGMGVSCPGF